MQTSHLLVGILCIVVVAVAVSIGVALSAGSDSNDSSSDRSTDLEFNLSDFETPTTIPQDKASVTIPLSDAGILYTLVQVSADGKFLTPVGRSYGGHDWEASAGKFSNFATFDCDNKDCSIDLPALDEGATYQVTSFQEPPYTSRDVAARFLEQTTFGPTLEEINSFSATTNVAFAEWIKKQQEEIPVLSHRQMFRKYLNARYEVASQVGPVTQPCKKGTRYRWTAFSVKDIEKTINFKTESASPRDKKVLSVDGHARTVMDSPVYIYSDEVDGLTETDWEDGDYEICYIFEDNGHAILLVDHPQLGECLPVIFVHYDGDSTSPNYYSNPPVVFDASIGIEPNHVVDIPSNFARAVDTQYFEEFDQKVREILVTTEVQEVTCSEIDPKSSEPVFAIWGNEYWIHDPRFWTFDNTVDSPLFDGGGQIVEEFADMYNPEFTAMCSNVPRSFLNEDQCYLSTAASACPYVQSGEEENYPVGLFTMTHEVIRTIFELTGSGEPDTVWIYAVEGLDIERDVAASSPCKVETVSRWIPVTCSEEASVVSTTTATLLSEIIAWFNEENTNPNMLDIWHPANLDTVCSAADMEVKGYEVPDKNGGNQCWKNVHPDHLNVYDFTYWTTDAHPGNRQGRNPIKEFAEAGKTVLEFPSWHEMTRWQNNKEYFYGPVRLGDEFNYFDLPSDIRTEELATALGVDLESGGNTPGGDGNSLGTIVCGSPNEVANDPMLGGSQGQGAFDAWTQLFQTTFEALNAQRRIVWTNAVLYDAGQLRQRIAWALSQILVISPGSITDGEFVTEAFLVYYDIFVRHAFGNYRDILKEVSYSPMMADMLTYFAGRSTAYVWEHEGNLEYADENYAREIMQLFTTGLFRLNKDGTEVLDSEGVHERVYTNGDIEEYARAWTGFLSQHQRGNAEMTYANRIDPMSIIPEWRDRFPKMGLNRKYIGDGYPLCMDLPSRHFLRKGATYRLLGESPSPELHQDPVDWNTDTGVLRMKLSSSSELYNNLCAPDEFGTCSFPTKVMLEDDLECNGNECFVDTMRVVEVDGLYYEYGRVPCVHQAFYNGGKTMVRRWEYENVMCGDPRTETASVACCSGDEWEEFLFEEFYFGERASFETAQQRCGGHLCDRDNRPSCDEDRFGTQCYDNNYWWTQGACDLFVKIDLEGKVAIVHVADEVPHDEVASLVSAVNAKTYFRVDWDGDFKEVTSTCGDNAACRSTREGCICKIKVTDEQAFQTTPTQQEMLTMLHIGAFSPGTTPAQSANGVDVYNLVSAGDLSADSVFSTIDDNGVYQLRKNTVSTVTIVGTELSFRNPPHFINLADEEPRDGHYETDATLDHYVYDRNTPPFLAIRFAQRFGISNPSPRYIETIANAFQKGKYDFTEKGNTVSFGSGQYGDLAASFAAVLLDREARDVVLDSDPTHGSLKEPLIKVLGLMRSLEFQLKPNEPLVELGRNVFNQIGEMAHQVPSVFSFFLPEYQPSGPVAQGSLVAPEAQLLTGPRIVDGLNGLYSLIKFGLTNCWGGFGPEERDRNYAECEEISSSDPLPAGIGGLTYENEGDNSPSEIIEELATLLTSGRLSEESRQRIEEILKDHQDVDTHKMAQLLIASSPEFHATNLVRKNGDDRASLPTPAQTDKPYKALVYVLLQGGYDSFNMLAPHTCTATNADGQTLLEQYISERTTIAMSDDERDLVIDASGQPCEQFAIHQNLPMVERLYNDGDLSFFANTGVIDTPVTKDDYYLLTRTELFAHNTMQQEAQRVDPWDTAPGTGILGRMCDVLADKGFNPQPITVQDATVATVGVPGESIPPLTASAGGVGEFEISPDQEDLIVSEYVDELNSATDLHSSVFAETWSQKLQKAVADSELLREAIDNVDLTQEYRGDGEYAGKIEAINTLISAHEDRGTDRDVFFLNLGGWDHHEQLKPSLAAEFGRLNGALELFEKEMKAQGLWEQVTLVVTSDFARTLTANSGEGSDHAWGGNYMVMGGSVKGGTIHGEYPADISLSGPLNVGRGRLIPTSSWESMFNGVLEWMGIETTDELDYCMPNRHNTGTKLYSMGEVFEASTRTLRGQS